MSAIGDAIRPIELEEIREARKRIAGTAVRTPLVRLELGPDFPDIRLKLENLQPINAYKLRGAANAVAMLSDAERRRGVWTISAGNAGQGVAYAARKAGIPCSVVAIETAPAAKMERMKALGATVIPVPYAVAWKAVLDGNIVVTLEETKRAMRLMAEKARVIAEGAGALPLAAALTGKAGQGPIVAIVSGGNIDLAKFAELITSVQS